MHSKFILFASCAALAAAAPAPVAGPAPKPIVLARHSNSYAPRADGQVDVPRLLNMIQRTKEKYGMKTSSFGKRASTAEEALNDQAQGGVDEEYYGNVNVGATAPQTFTVDFDTGSADFFVPGPSCGTKQGCVGTTKYNQRGTNEGNTTSITYGSGNVDGENYFDTVCVAGLCAGHTNVISLTDAAGFSTSDSEGLMGMGFSTIANSKQPTFFERLMALGEVTQPEFSFYLGRAKSGTGANSELTLGGADSSKYTGAMKSHPVTVKGYWQLAVDAVRVRGRNAANTAGQAAIDTGTTLILAPTAAASAIFANIPGAFPLLLQSGSLAETLYAYPCNTPASALPSFVFGGTPYALNPLDFNLGSAGNSLSTELDGLLGGGEILSSGGNCIAAIIAEDIMPGQSFYVVGDTFLKNWYSTYSYGTSGHATVSFAKAV